MKDSLLWVVFVVLAFTLGLSFISRDKQRDFGSITYGKCPNFVLKDADGQDFSERKLKGFPWVAMRYSAEGEASRKNLQLLQQMKQGALRDVNCVVFSPDDVPVAQGLIVLVDEKQMSSFLTEGKVFLIDQNFIVRGCYDDKNIQQLPKQAKMIL